jgi:2-iminoacetate synthase ThiH
MFKFIKIPEGYKPSAFGLKNIIESNADLRRNLIAEICIQTGLNTTQGYDGIESNEDELYYLERIMKLIQKNKIHI